VIAHVVLLSVRPDLPRAELERAAETLVRAAREIPGILRFRVGRRVTHGVPGYEQQMRTNFDYALLLEFDDRHALTDYLRAPAHEALGHLFSAATSQALAYDYEIVEPADALMLLRGEPSA
jgi:Stress responsive A/B Barrel Domain